MKDHTKPQVLGPLQGKCNICCSVEKLTADHVPPKGTQKIRQVDLFRIVDVLSMDRPVSWKRARHMQSGTFYRSICGRCNNSLLGAKYDPVLVKFANSITEIVRSTLHLPSYIQVSTEPGLLARAVLGHLLAIGVERAERTPLLDSVRAFVIDDSLPMPEGIEIHYWLYPYQRQVSIRTAVMMTDMFANQVQFGCLKFFPVGFLVTWDNPRHELISAPRLSPYMLNSGKHRVDLMLPLTSVPHQFWPEAPDSSGAVLYGDDAYAAYSTDSRHSS